MFNLKFVVVFFSIKKTEREKEKEKTDKERTDVDRESKEKKSKSKSEKKAKKEEKKAAKVAEKRSSSSMMSAVDENPNIDTNKVGAGHSASKEGGVGSAETVQNDEDQKAAKKKKPATEIETSLVSSGSVDGAKLTEPASNTDETVKVKKDVSKEKKEKKKKSKKDKKEKKKHKSKRRSKS